MGQPFTARLTRMHLVTKMRDLINAKNSDHEVTNAHGGTDFRAI